MIDEGTAVRVLDTPLGPLGLTACAVGVLSIGFLDHDRSPVAGRPRLSGSGAPEDQVTAVLDDAERQLREYFEGRRREFSVAVVDGSAPPFQRNARQAIREVPFGTTVTYGELARRLGHPGAARAVGTAMAANPVPILVPCHRVVPAHGGPGRYAGGEERKEFLLRLEASVDAHAAERQGERNDQSTGGGPITTQPL